MFTGLVQAIGTVTATAPSAAGCRLSIDCPQVAARVALGDSVAVNGTCLTVASLDAGLLHFDAVPDTLARTTLGSWRPGQRVHIEPALRMGDALGGHWVQGHVEGTGRVESIDRSEGRHSIRIAVDAGWREVLCDQGSVTVDGVSLTIARTCGDAFDVALVPHTLGCTVLGTLAPGDRVNLEADPLARLVARAVELRLRQGSGGCSNGGARPVEPA